MKKTLLSVLLVMIMALMLSCSKDDNIIQNDLEPVQSVTEKETVTDYKTDDKTDEINEISVTAAEDNKPNAYRFLCKNEAGIPVKDVKLQICTDETCIMLTGDENGEVLFDGEPYAYSVHVYSYPKQYLLLTDKEFETAAEYSEYEVIFTDNNTESDSPSAD